MVSPINIIPPVPYINISFVYEQHFMIILPTLDYVFDNTLRFPKSELICGVIINLLWDSKFCLLFITLQNIRIIHRKFYCLY
jgi:hypothetical protein